MLTLINHQEMNFGSSWDLKGDSQLRSGHLCQVLRPHITPDNTALSTHRLVSAVSPRISAARQNISSGWTLCCFPSQTSLLRLGPGPALRHTGQAWAALGAHWYQAQRESQPGEQDKVSQAEVSSYPCSGDLNAVLRVATGPGTDWERPTHPGWAGPGTRSPHSPPIGRPGSRDPRPGLSLAAGPRLLPNTWEPVCEMMCPRVVTTGPGDQARALTQISPPPLIGQWHTVRASDWSAGDPGPDITADPNEALWLVATHYSPLLAIMALLDKGWYHN